MRKLDVALMVSEIRHSLLQILHGMTEDSGYNEQQAIRDIKELIHHIDSEQYPIE